MDIQLSTITAGGRRKPEAEWTAQANKHVEKAVSEQMAQIGIHVLGPADVEEIERNADEKERRIQLIKLHEAVGHSICRHELGEDYLKLPGKNDKFDSSLGPEAKFLKEKYGADYALFVYLRDSYASGGRAALCIVGVIFGAPISGGVQFGFVSLVDLETGDVVWLNRLRRGVGDLRTQETASNSVKVLLSNFPK
ncbi:MAG: hypothetical protein JRI72_11475 [Deltaproteobacteria bacterium]|nr:hypothetical protein [Deltaproteobacteria bacterium]